MSIFFSATNKPIEIQSGPVSMLEFFKPKLYDLLNEQNFFGEIIKNYPFYFQCIHVSLYSKVKIFAVYLKILTH